MNDAGHPHVHAYRPDIDGLRALAVAPVVLFHAGLFGVTGGYVGVDVFFVISGYLITQIIVRDLAAGQPLYSDDDHLSRRGADRIRPIIEIALQRRPDAIATRLKPPAN